MRQLAVLVSSVMVRPGGGGGGFGRGGGPGGGAGGLGMLAIDIC
jgi:hypothetical protein